MAQISPQPPKFEPLPKRFFSPLITQLQLSFKFSNPLQRKKNAVLSRDFESKVGLLDTNTQ